MKIRFVTPPPSKRVGGIELAVEGLREALQQQGVDVLQGGDLGDEEALHHFHGLWDPSHSRLAARLRRLGRPYVVSPHGMLEPWAFRHRRWKKLPYFWLLERRFLMGAQSVFVTSEMEAEHMSRVIRHPRVEIVPLGCRDRHGPDYAAARELLRWSTDERFILFLSRIDVKKGLDMLLQAMVDDSFQWEGWNLVVVGDGESAYVASLKSMATSLSNQLPTVEWVGPVWGEDRWQYIQAADLFCLPTHSENFGLAVLEALHVGTPVLTTDQTPWSEFGEHDGFFIARPEISSLKEVLCLAQEKIGSHWSAGDRQKLSSWTEDRFAWKNLVNSYCDAYQRST